jgi:hypothetical protein
MGREDSNGAAQSLKFADVIQVQTFKVDNSGKLQPIPYFFKLEPGHRTCTLSSEPFFLQPYLSVIVGRLKLDITNYSAS